MQQIRTVSIGEVQAFLQNHPGGFLIDVLPPEFHVQQHIPGSSGVCVFETAFQEKMRALVPDMAAPLLVYGAGGSLDSAVAAEKLQREGYTDISLFAGGLEAWRKAGLPLEGEGVDFPVRDESPLPMFKEYMLIPEKSFIQWACHNTVHSHDGTLSVSGGELRFPHGPQGGERVLDDGRDSIACRDLTGRDVARLIAHLNPSIFRRHGLPGNWISCAAPHGGHGDRAYAPLAGAAQRAAD
ncbi:MAG: rhodanese-like domain-containing protein [Bilophila wadsworthia]